MQLLNFGTGINFGSAGNLKEFSPVGFSASPDDVSTWSEASTCELAFRLPPMRQDLRFTIEVFPYLVDKQLTEQSCWVFFNGLFVHYQKIKTPVEMAFTIPRDLLSPRVNRLSFALPNATAPKELNLGNDLRLLGLAFVKLAAGDSRAGVQPAGREAEAADAAARSPRQTMGAPPSEGREATERGPGPLERRPFGRPPSAG